MKKIVVRVEAPQLSLHSGLTIGLDCAAAGSGAGTGAGTPGFMVGSCRCDKRDGQFWDDPPLRRSTLSLILGLEDMIGGRKGMVPEFLARSCA